MKIVRKAKIIKLEETSNIGAYTPTYQDINDGSLWTGRSTVSNTPYIYSTECKIVAKKDGTAYEFDRILPIVLIVGAFLAVPICASISMILCVLAIAALVLSIQLINTISLVKSNRLVANSKDVVEIQGKVIGLNEERISTRNGGHRIYKYPVVEYEYNGNKYQHVCIEPHNRFWGEPPEYCTIYLYNDAKVVRESGETQTLKRESWKSIKTLATFCLIFVVFFGIVYLNSLDDAGWAVIWDWLEKLGVIDMLKEKGILM